MSNFQKAGSAVSNLSSNARIDSEKAEIKQLAVQSTELFGGYDVKCFKIKWLNLGLFNYIRSFFDEDYANKVRDEFFEHLQGKVEALMPLPKDLKVGAKKLSERIANIPNSDMTAEGKKKLEDYVQNIALILDEDEKKLESRDLTFLDLKELKEQIDGVSVSSDELVKKKNELLEVIARKMLSQYEMKVQHSPQNGDLSLVQLKELKEQIDGISVSSDELVSKKKKLLKDVQDIMSFRQGLEQALKVDHGLIYAINDVKDDDSKSLAKFEEFYTKAHDSAKKADIHFQDYETRVSGFNDRRNKGMTAEFTITRQVQIMNSDIESISKQTLEKLKLLYDDACTKAEKAGVYKNFKGQIDQYNPYLDKNRSIPPMRKVALAQAIIKGLMEAVDIVKAASNAQEVQ